tara:strand:+ start:176 stop:403 length:228 start_codon:yes stop_codon:yes gene_type:complete
MEMEIYRHRPIHLSLSLSVYLVYLYCVQTTLPRLLCRIPGQHASSWIYCDGAFDVAMQAYNATAAIVGNSTSFIG